MASQNSRQDANRFTSMLAVSGSLGTAHAGTEDLVQMTADASTGAQYVYNLGPAGSVTLGNTPGGTINSIGSIDTIGTMPAISLAINSGTLSTLGTIGSITNVGTLKGVDLVTRIGNIGTIESGTVTTTLALNTGTITTIVAGTQNTLGTVGVVNNIVTGTIASIGSINTIGTMPALSLALNTGTITTIVAGTLNTLGTVGVINAGSVVITVGTIGGKAASGAVAVANPVQIAGTDAGGTIYSPLVTTAGALTIVDLPKGTVTSVGSVVGMGVVSVLTKGTISAGTVEVSAGTIASVGTVPGVGVVSVLTKGTISIGTVVGVTAHGGSATTNPVLIAGTDSNGNVYAPLVAADGKLIISNNNNFASGTVTTGSLSNVAMLNAGTVVQASGTLTTQVAGTLNTLGTVEVVNNIVTGTLANSGTTTGVGVVSNVTTGSINILTGTLQSAGTTTGIGTVSNLGSLNTVTSVSNIVTGTLASVKINATPAGSTILTNHVLGTSGAAFFGTLLATAGAGTNVYLTGLQIVVHSGTPDVAITNNVAGSTGAGVYARGLFPPGGGIARDFNPPINAGAAGTLCYYINTGTASFIVNYWVSP